MGNRLTENAKRSHLAIWAALGCRDCITVIEIDLEDGDIGLQMADPPVYCDKHGCSATTKRGTRCRNTATYPDARMCGIHLDAATHPGPGGIR